MSKLCECDAYIICTGPYDPWLFFSQGIVGPGQERILCIIEHHGRARKSLEHTTQDMQEIKNNSIVDKKCRGFVVISLEKVYEVFRKFPVPKNRPDPIMDNWGECSFKVKGSWYRYDTRIEVGFHRHKNTYVQQSQVQQGYLKICVPQWTHFGFCGSY